MSDELKAAEDAAKAAWAAYVPAKEACLSALVAWAAAMAALDALRDEI